MDWRILEVNDAYTRHTGIARDQIVGRRASERFPEAVPEYLPRFARVVANQTSLVFETYARAVGRHQRVVTFPAGDHRFASTIEDMSERKSAEEALRTSEAKSPRFSASLPTGSSSQKQMMAPFWMSMRPSLLHWLFKARDPGGGGKDAGSVLCTDVLKSLVSWSATGNQWLTMNSISGRKTGGPHHAGLLAPIEVGEAACMLAVATTSQSAAVRRGVATSTAELAQVAEERARTEERQRLARELHDSVSQALYGVSLGSTRH